MRAPRDGAQHCGSSASSSRILAGIAEQHGALVGLAQRLERKRQKRAHASKRDHLAVVRDQRHGEPDHRREALRRAGPAASTMRSASTALGAVGEAEAAATPASIASTAHRRAGRPAAPARHRAQRGEQPQRIAVVRRAARSCRRRPRDRAAAGAATSARGPASRPWPRAARATCARPARRRAPHGRRATGTRARPRPARSATSRPVASRRSAASFGQARAEASVHRAIGRLPLALALHPNQAEVRARCRAPARRPVDHREARAERAHAERDRRGRRGRRRRWRDRSGRS